MIHPKHKMYQQCVIRFNSEIKRDMKNRVDTPSTYTWYYRRFARVEFDDYDWYYMPEFDLITREKRKVL